MCCKHDITEIYTNVCQLIVTINDRDVVVVVVVMF